MVWVVKLASGEYEANTAHLRSRDRKLARRFNDHRSAMVAAMAWHADRGARVVRLVKKSKPDDRESIVRWLREECNRAANIAKECIDRGDYFTSAQWHFKAKTMSELAIQIERKDDDESEQARRDALAEANRKKRVAPK